MTKASGSNPFATRHFAPGAIRYFFPKPLSIQSLVCRIQQAPKGRAAIVGPHGSGKSTLMTELFGHPSLKSVYPNPNFVRISSDHHPIRRWRVCLQAIGHRSLTMIDGYEQLQKGMQWSLRALARTRNTHLLISAHSNPRLFEEIWRTFINRDVEQYVIAQMIAEDPRIDLERVLASNAWSESRARHGQNLRESLFDMYDWYRDQVDAQIPAR